MSDMQISRSDIEQLAQKLDAIGPDFTNREWMVLSAVFAVATEAADQSGPGAGAAQSPADADRPAALRSWTADEEDGIEDDGTPGKIGRPSLHDQVLRSFTPEDDDDDDGNDSGSASRKIGNA